MIRKIFQWLFNWPDCIHSGDTETEECLFRAWAFGNARHEATIEKLKAWNERHSDLLKLYPDGNMKEDLKKMRALYAEHKKLRFKNKC